MRRFMPVAGLVLWAASAPALASGYGLREHSTDAMGMAYAGSAASETDASYMAYNPASLAGVEDADAMVSVIGLFPHSRSSYSGFTSAGNPSGGNDHPSDFVNQANVPAIAARWRMNERWALGLSVNAPWGLKTEYPGDWVGRYYALKTRLEVISITPIVSYEVTPNVAVAAGPIAQYAKGTLSNAVAFGLIGALNGFPTTPGGDDGRAVIRNADDWSWGFVAGVMFRLNEHATLGVSYRSAVSQAVKGPMHFTLDAAGVGATLESVTGMFADTEITAKVTTPDVVNAGLRFQLSDRWTALVGADWTNWSRFKALVIDSKNPAQPNDVTTTRWKDSWFVSAGAEYALDPQWTLRAGVAYDDSPVPDSTRSPRIPDHPRTWLSVGATWHATENLDLKVAYAHLFLDDAHIEQTPALAGNDIRGTLVGTSDVNADAAGVEIAWRW
jgi:long-chain fatty acid transport protein